MIWLIAYVVISVLAWLVIKTNPPACALILALAWPITLLWMVKATIHGDMRWTIRRGTTWRR